jgi:hypothetical protein
LGGRGTVRVHVQTGLLGSGGVRLPCSAAVCMCVAAIRPRDGTAEEAVKFEMCRATYMGVTNKPGCEASHLLVCWSWRPCKTNCPTDWPPQLLRSTTTALLSQRHTDPHSPTDCQVMTQAFCRIHQACTLARRRPETVGGPQAGTNYHCQPQAAVWTLAEHLSKRLVPILSHCCSTSRSRQRSTTARLPLVLRFQLSLDLRSRLSELHRIAVFTHTNLVQGAAGGQLSA